MPNPIVPFATLDKGRDWSLNDSRLIDVRAPVIHRPQGTCPGVVSVGKSRNHSTPGTFTFTLCGDGVLHQHYPWNVRCSGAAGGNYAGPHVEIEDYQGNRPTEPALHTLGRLMLWARDEWGQPTDFYAGEYGRVWVDRDSNFRAWVNHSAIDYPPNRSYLHYDGLLRTEIEHALALAGGGASTPIPEDDDVRLVTRKGDSANRLVGPYGWTLEWSGDHAGYGIQRGALPFAAAGVPVKEVQPAEYDALPKAPQFATVGDLAGLGAGSGGGLSVAEIEQVATAAGAAAASAVNAAAPGVGATTKGATKSALTA